MNKIVTTLILILKRTKLLDRLAIILIWANGNDIVISDSSGLEPILFKYKKTKMTKFKKLSKLENPTNLF